MAKNVSQVSLEELNAARNEASNHGLSTSNGSNFSDANLTEKAKTVASLPEKSLPYIVKNHYYIDKLKDSEIKEFFKPFDYISHERKDNLICVLCNSFIATFNDFELVIDNIPFDMAEKPQFNTDHISTLLERMDITLPEAIEEYLTTCLSERFYSYANARKEYKENNIIGVKKEASKLPRDIRNFVEEIANRQKEVVLATHRRGHNGIYNQDN